MPAMALPKESAYGSAVNIGYRLFYVGGGNGIDWSSSMLRLALDQEDAEWVQASHASHASFAVFKWEQL